MFSPIMMDFSCRETKLIMLSAHLQTPHIQVEHGINDAIKQLQKFLKKSLTLYRASGFIISLTSGDVEE